MTHLTQISAKALTSVELMCYNIGCAAVFCMGLARMSVHNQPFDWFPYMANKAAAEYFAIAANKVFNLRSSVTGVA
jgi:hypothetical protein